MKLLIRLLLLIVATALLTCGVLLWQAEGFRLDGLLRLDNLWVVHPVHLLIVGIAMLPVTLWEIFLLEPRSPADTLSDLDPRGERP